MLLRIILVACLAVALKTQAQINPAKIDIIRDKYGVPHIFGKTDPEVAYGLAWAHAEDDFTTIQQSLLAGKAMLAQYQGKKGASIDYIVHLLRIPELVEERYESDLAPDFKKLLEGYSAGLNAYAAKHPKEVLLKKIFPVTPKDMVQYSVLQLCVLSGADKALAAIFGGTVPLLENYKTQGSNAFAFNSNKTTDGNVYLAINAHQPLEGPVAFYEAHLSSEEGWNILGANFPGAPSILHGVNEHLGWAHTVNDPDKLDVYQLEINPENKTQYKFDGKWETLEEKVAPLKVKIAGLKINIKKKAYWSKYGPTIITDRGTFSIRMPAQMDIRGLEQWYRFNKAKNFTEFKAALNMKAIPGYNIVYADKYDSIYYISNGRIPVRDKNYNWKTTLPGNTSATLWNQLHPIESLPQVLQPKSGFVYNTNHSPFHSTEGTENPKVTDITMGYETLENNRSKRFEEMLQPLNKVSYEDFKQIKFSRQFPSNFYFPYNIDTLFMLDETKYTDIADLISNLKTWDKIGNAESIGAGTFFMITHTVYDDRALYIKQKTITEQQAVKIIRAAKNKMLTNFNRTNLQLGDIQKLVRGNVVLPLPGLPDVLAPMYSIPYKDGMYKGNQGDAYIELVRFTKDGPIIESVNVYGASARKESPHYTDQMDMYVKQQTKTMTLNKATVYQQAVKKYNPL
ncbi:MAG: peptidase S45 [Sphingobacteriia bacterium 24-36-13]|jgi:acyl-homoserine-lactone acylase|uniref:penicillin acylase family protein n=1 Tax=Sediminibacterium sp. TaxID=1917865 RepID=UPI000BCCB088|nr:penicillin acylase family protein [Sediminibacterium sp.]OYZ52898.1 MAG: peptidase S45 [Sphingobacteriia bacterium 24-36-13]OZA63419.1 MAG: peptidase S45 [Sphingobacteriia bacterium 39-36-14]HQS24765.1 penicillin acylase family protein [Sediminibacterium sp.]HQS36108.1 penicillin acylase family protein [Sediminibacterium sp.]